MFQLSGLHCILAYWDPGSLWPDGFQRVVANNFLQTNLHNLDTSHITFHTNRLKELENILCSVLCCIILNHAICHMLYIRY